jgi:hypothetical protein
MRHECAAIKKYPSKSIEFQQKFAVGGLPSVCFILKITPDKTGSFHSIGCIVAMDNTAVYFAANKCKSRCRFSNRPVIDTSKGTVGKGAVACNAATGNHATSGVVNKPAIVKSAVAYWTYLILNIQSGAGSRMVNTFTCIAETAIFYH